MMTTTEDSGLGAFSKEQLIGYIHKLKADAESMRRPGEGQVLVNPSEAALAVSEAKAEASQTNAVRDELLAAKRRSDEAASLHAAELREAVETGVQERQRVRELRSKLKVLQDFAKQRDADAKTLTTDLETERTASAAKCAELEERNTHVRTLLRKSHAATKARDDELETWRKTAASAAARADVAHGSSDVARDAAAACFEAASAEIQRLDALLKDTKLALRDAELNFASYKLRAQKVLKRSTSGGGGVVVEREVEVAAERATECCASATIAASEAAATASCALAELWRSESRALSANFELQEEERRRGEEREVLQQYEAPPDPRRREEDECFLKSAILTVATTEDETERLAAISALCERLGLSAEERTAVEAALGLEDDDAPSPQCATLPVSTFSRIINAELTLPFFR